MFNLCLFFKPSYNYAKMQYAKMFYAEMFYLPNWPNQ